MRFRPMVVCLFAAGSLLTIAHSALADSCDDASSAAQHYIDSYDTFRKMDVEALQRLVKALCDSDEAERKQVFRDEADRVESTVASEKDRLDNAKADASSKLATAISDDQCKDKIDDLKKLQDRVDEIAGRIDKIAATGVKLGSNPAFDKLRELGQKAHDDYYSHNSKCADYRDIRVGDLKPDCLDPDECWVIELKPDNSRAASNGWKKATESRDLLNKDDEFDKMAASNDQLRDKFTQCKDKFRARVDCYHYCPEVDDDGNLKSTSLDWATCKN